MKLRLWFLFLLFLTMGGALRADAPTITLTINPHSVGYSGTWCVQGTDKLARSWSTGDISSDDLDPVVLNLTPFDGLLAHGLYEIEISNNLIGCPPEGVTFLDSILVNFPDGKILVFNNISPSSSGQSVQLTFLYYPFD